MAHWIPRQVADAVGFVQKELGKGGGWCVVCGDTNAEAARPSGVAALLIDGEANTTCTLSFAHPPLILIFFLQFGSF